jgi:hypothetical protein
VTPDAYRLEQLRGRVFLYLWTSGRGITWGQLRAAFPKETDASLSRAVRALARAR